MKRLSPSLGLLALLLAPAVVVACSDDGSPSPSSPDGGGTSIADAAPGADAAPSVDAAGDASKSDAGGDASKSDAHPDADADAGPVDTGTILSFTAPTFSSLTMACIYLGGGGSLSITNSCMGDITVEGAISNNAVVEMTSPDYSICPIQGFYAKLADVPTDFAARCPSWTRSDYVLAPGQAYFIRDNATNAKHFRLRVVSVDASRNVTLAFDALD